jgi:hypothetical protein
MTGRTNPGACDRYQGKFQTNLEWLKAPERTVEEIVDFIRQPCTTEAKSAYCEQFESCRDCWIAWLLAKRR